MNYMKKSKAFIEILLKNKNVKSINIYEAHNNGYWEVYFSMSGFVGDKYFDINLMKIIDLEPLSVIANTTDHKGFFEGLLRKCDLL